MVAFCLRQPLPDAAFYNQIMHFTPSCFGAFPLTLTACLLASSGALAQTPAPQPAKPASAPASTAPAPAQPAQPELAPGQRSERIRVEDKSVVIDELRVGGETKSITVRPKNGMPTYQVAPATGERSWKVLGF